MKNPIGSFITLSAACFMAGSAMATVSYTYENDDKTLVATVTDADAELTNYDEDQARFTAGLTNFVKRGAKSLKVWENVANSFTGDIRIEENYLSFYANALGINRAQGKIQIHNGALVHIGNKHLTIARDIEYGYGGDWGGRSIQVWDGKTATITGKVTTGNRNAYVYVYKGGTLDFTGGIEDPASGGAGYFCVGAYNGSSLTFTAKPVVMSHPIYFPFENYHINNSDTYRDESGYFSHITFAVPSNNMMSVGYDNGSSNSRLRYHDLRTTVDWAFDKSDMKVYFGNDARWDLCGTEQRVGQFDVKVTSGNASIVTNSFDAPATLHMGMIYATGSSEPDIRFGGNLLVVFEGDIGNTKINHEMTAKGCLTVNQAGTLNFLENGSWANATNVTVNGTGKIAIANANALGKRANVNLAANSSLEIASGVTVTVRTLTIGGAEQPNGNYTFGSGTLRVFKPRTRLIIR